MRAAFILSSSTEEYFDVGRDTGAPTGRWVIDAHQCGDVGLDDIRPANRDATPASLTADAVSGKDKVV